MWLQIESGPLCSALAWLPSEQPLRPPYLPSPFYSLHLLLLQSECLTCYHHRDKHPKAAYDMITEGFTEPPHGNFQIVAIFQQDFLALKLHNMSADNNLPFWCGGRT